MIEPQQLRWLIGCLLALVYGLAHALVMRSLVHLLQLESYQLPGYFRALRRLGWRGFRGGALQTLANIGLYFACGGLWYMVPLLWPLGNSPWGLALIALASLLVAGLIYRSQRRQPAKKALDFTPRVRRLCGVLWGLQIALFGLVWLAWDSHYFPALLLPLLNPLWLALAALMATPMEKAINRSFFRDAQRKLDAQPGLIRIGITGSYGKTSTKFLLKTLLSEKYNVYATPASFNTPMGVTRVIREQLTPQHQVFIAEMGARHVGDIKEMCELVHPTLGLLTSVGPQHLDTFGTVERVTSTKYELIEALPADGAAFFAQDGGLVEGLYAKCPLDKKFLAGQSLRVGDIEVGPFGSRFTLTAQGGEKALCETRLLGEHNIRNLLLCCETALYLGLTLAQIAAGIKKLEPVEHRLQLLATGNGVTVIDDAFNSNPSGAQAALAVLADFPPRRIIITPGMVELGDRQDELNKAFGAQMVGCVDIAILIGKRRTDPIAEGLRAGGFAEENLHRVATLDESTALLGTIVRAGDTVLYENDLPDNYAE